MMDIRINKISLVNDKVVVEIMFDRDGEVQIVINRHSKTKGFSLDFSESQQSDTVGF